MLAQSYNFAVRKKEIMRNLNEKISCLVSLGDYMLSDNEDWQQVKDRAVQGNQWFSREQIDHAVKNMVQYFLQAPLLQEWLQHYTPSEQPKIVGITMAGNIPLVGFHDFLCAYLSGHQVRIKLSSKDQILLPHLLQVLADCDSEVLEQVQFTDNLRQCDAYIATGSNNTARYFEQYFGKYPHIIRKNRTSVAVLDGTETPETLAALAEDVFLYYGLGCRNVTQVCIPRDYDFAQLFAAFAPYKDYMHHHKYRNNYDYYLAIYLLNKVPYLSNDAVLLVENENPFSAVAVVHYRYYDDKASLLAELQQNQDIQCVVAPENIPFGAAQRPSLFDFADGVDTMAFLCSL